MQQVTYDRSLDVSADSVWQVLADFGGFLKWAAQGSIITEGEGQGMIRRLDLEGQGKVAERADVIDHENKILVYTLVDGQPIGMSSYRATVKLQAINADSCNIAWLGEFDVVAGADPSNVATALEGAYTGMTEALLTYIRV